MSTPTQIAFRMKIKPGAKEKYKMRHDDIWPELSQCLKDAGISDYSIFLDETTGSLFAVLRIDNPETLKDLPNFAVVKRWWQHMADIMETNEDWSPVTQTMERVFHIM